MLFDKFVAREETNFDKMVKQMVMID